MARIIFEDDGIDVEVPDGTLIQDAVESANASLMFGCRNGECATCIVQVLEGMENLPPTNEEEELTLLEEEREKGVRLACQLTIKSGTLRLKAAEDVI